jgi:hypothetical protein
MIGVTFARCIAQLRLGRVWLTAYRGNFGPPGPIYNQTLREDPSARLKLALCVGQIRIF